MPHLSWHEVADLAKKAGAKYPELVSAQYALESGWGEHVSGKHNYFGIKGKGTKVRTREVYNGKEVFIEDEFKDFESPEECIKWLVDRWYLDYDGYKGVNNAPNQEEAARELQKQGYATDPVYANLLIKLLKQHATSDQKASTPQAVDATQVNSIRSMIKLKDAAKYYKEEPHQIKAWDALQAVLTEEQLKLFETLYRGGSGETSEAADLTYLEVPYYYQRNSNTWHGERMCQSSCIAMVIEYLFPEIIDGDDDTWLLEVFKHGDTVSQSAQLSALRANGVENVRFLMDGSEKDLTRILDKGYPVPVGILHKGTVESPSGGGHWITLIGYDDENFLVHDPFGELNIVNGGYSRTGPRDGCNRKYNRKNLMKRWLIASKSDGWYYDFSEAKLD